MRQFGGTGRRRLEQTDIFCGLILFSKLYMLYVTSDLRQNTMKFLGNILWLVLGGLLIALIY